MLNLLKSKFLYLFVRASVLLLVAFPLKFDSVEEFSKPIPRLAELCRQTQFTYKKKGRQLTCAHFATKVVKMMRFYPFVIPSA